MPLLLRVLQHLVKLTIISLCPNVRLIACLDELRSNTYSTSERGHYFQAEGRLRVPGRFVEFLVASFVLHVRSASDDT